MILALEMLQQSDPGPNRFWYSVTFMAGAYWSIAFLSGNFNPKLMVLGPIGLCAAIAVISAGRIGTTALAVMLNLLAMFCIGIGIGYWLHVSGVIELFSDRLKCLRSWPEQSALR